MKAGDFSEEFVIDLAQSGYEEGNAEFNVIPQNSALLVIDMQDEFVKPRWTPYWVPEATRQVHLIQTLIDRCRDFGVPIIYTVYSNQHQMLDRPKSGPYMPNRYRDLDIDQASFFREGRVWYEIAPKQEDIIIHKPSYGAFYDTPLETILKNYGKDTVIICGTLTNYCCGLTARQAYERSFKVVFGSDVTSTDDPDMQAMELKVLRRGFAKVMTSREIITLMEHALEQSNP